MPDITYVPVEKVQGALRTVKDTLGECMSFYTRKIVKELGEKLEAGKQIEPVELRQLMTFYAKDCEFKEKGAFPCQREEAAQTD